MKQDIIPYNDKSQLHGYQEWYWANDFPWFRGIAKKGKAIGYYENHIIQETTYYIK